MLVMVADDDPTTCTLVATILKRAGHTTVIAQDAMQVVMLAKKHRPDVIVLDVQMPAGTGTGALEKLRTNAITSDTPVVVLSGTTDKQLIDQLLQMGASEFLAKPVDPESLLSAIERATSGVD
jgi:CheY-like chemotaxis protein